jgi:hypothetical protein
MPQEIEHPGASYGTSALRLYVTDTPSAQHSAALRRDQRALHLSALRRLGLVPLVDPAGNLMTPLDEMALAMRTTPECLAELVGQDLIRTANPSTLRPLQ